MINDIVGLLRGVFLRHKGVRTFKYQDSALNNAQNNHKYFQVYVDDVSMHELNITTNIFKATFDIYILGFPTEGLSISDVQTNAYTIACDAMAYIDNMEEFRGVVSVYDYSIMTLSHYTDDDASGVKLTLTLEVPSPVNLCSLEDNFNDEPYEDEEESPIDINVDTVGDITINPIKLPRNRRC